MSSAVAVAGEEAFGNLARQMSKIVDQLNRGYYSFYSNETWTPNVNLYETEEAYQVCVDLAGVDKDKINIEVHDQRLTIKGMRPAPQKNHIERPAAEHAREVSGGSSPNAGGSSAGGGAPTDTKVRTRVHLMEIDHGAFVRVVELPHDVAADQITAEHRNGLLWIELPKK